MIVTSRFSRICGRLILLLFRWVVPYERTTILCEVIDGVPELKRARRRWEFHAAEKVVKIVRAGTWIEVDYREDGSPTLVMDDSWQELGKQALEEYYREVV